MKTYLRISPTAAAVSAEGYIQTVQHPIEWVGSRSKATADYLESVLVTQQKLKNQLAIETTLEEIPSDNAMQSKWVICRSETLTRDFAEAFGKLVAGKSPEEAIAILHDNGLYVAYRSVDGALTYPVYTDPDGKPAHGTGNTGAKARLDVEAGKVVGIEFFPETTG